MTFFDDTLKYAEANYCVDQSRVFAIGMSAGAWMSIILGCERANVIRAHAQVSGGLPMFIHPGVDCKGSVAALFVHDTGDPSNTINGGYAARDRVCAWIAAVDAACRGIPRHARRTRIAGPDTPSCGAKPPARATIAKTTSPRRAIWKFFSQF